MWSVQVLEEQVGVEFQVFLCPSGVGEAGDVAGVQERFWSLSRLRHLLPEGKFATGKASLLRNDAIARHARSRVHAGAMAAMEQHVRATLTASTLDTGESLTVFNGLTRSATTMVAAVEVDLVQSASAETATSTKVRKQDTTTGKRSQNKCVP